jgi:hypothetical protein
VAPQKTAIAKITVAFGTIFVHLFCCSVAKYFLYCLVGS